LPVRPAPHKGILVLRPFAGMKVLSPCTGVCKLDGDDICIGCFRSKDEIACWTQMSDREKYFTIVALDGRREMFAPAGQSKTQ
jgi:uncharacterized protein